MTNRLTILQGDAIRQMRTGGRFLQKTAGWKPGDMPYATHEGILHLMGHKLRCARLNTGETVIEADDMADLLEAMGMKP